jgi:hypothetical protein
MPACESSGPDFSPPLTRTVWVRLGSSRAPEGPPNNCGGDFATLRQCDLARCRRVTKWPLLFSVGYGVNLWRMACLSSQQLGRCGCVLCGRKRGRYGRSAGKVSVTTVRFLAPCRRSTDRNHWELRHSAGVGRPLGGAGCAMPEKARYDSESRHETSQRDEQSCVFA